MKISVIVKNIFHKYRTSDVMYRAGIWFVLVTVIDQAISLLTQPVINRILSVEEIGIYSVYNTWQSIFSIIATCNLFGGVLEVYITKYNEQKKQVVGSLMTLMILISSCFLLLCLIFQGTLSVWIGLSPVYLMIMVASIVANAVIQFWAVPKRFAYEYKTYAVLIVLLFFTKCIFSIALAFEMKQNRVLGRIIGMVLPACVVALVLFFRMMKGVDFRHISQYWKKALCYNIPLLPHYLSSILLASSDRIMIQKMVGEYEAGLYSTVYAYSALTLVVFNALNSSYTPFSYRAIMEQKYDALREKTKGIVLLSILFAIVMMVLAPEGLMILGGRKFMGAIGIIPILIVGIYLSSFYYIFSNVEFVYEKTTYIFPVTLIGAGTNIILNYIFLPIYGYRAAAYTTILGYVLIAGLHGILATRIVKRDIYHVRSLFLILCGFAVIAMGIKALYHVNIWWRVGIYSLLTAATAAMVFRRSKCGILGRDCNRN